MCSKTILCDTFRVLEQRYRNVVILLTLKLCGANADWKFHGGVQYISMIHKSHKYHNMHHILCVIIQCLIVLKNTGAESGVFPC